MPGDARQADLDLKRTMLEEGYLFDFFQLVHLLETWLGRPVPIGRGGPFRAEGLRLRPDPSLVFSPADVRRVEEPAEDRTATSDAAAPGPLGLPDHRQLHGALRRRLARARST